MPDGLTIGEAARVTELSAHTLRFYERLGLLPGVRRGGNGGRRYGPDDLVWLEYLKRLRATGMPLAEMKRFAELRGLGAFSVPDRRRLLEAHSARVRGRIGELQANLAAIERKLRLLEQSASGGKAEQEEV